MPSPYPVALLGYATPLAGRDCDVGVVIDRSGPTPLRLEKYVNEAFAMNVLIIPDYPCPVILGWSWRCLRFSGR